MWKGSIIPDGYSLKVNLQGNRGIKEDFTCWASELVQKIEFSCRVPGNLLPTSSSVLNFGATFTFTTSVVDKWIPCKCTAYYSIIGTGKTETSSFLLTSQGSSGGSGAGGGGANGMEVLTAGPFTLLPLVVVTSLHTFFFQ
ncbi:unnamed protein product [Lymnaea stagnalis]|uniref:Uncharacterized protein n=1 Tax=Lymnaea stagnalis TaxID=6523 RepID=A0AAV2HTK6_LYMST